MRRSAIDERNERLAWNVASLFVHNEKHSKSHFQGRQGVYRVAVGIASRFKNAIERT